jgi:hypothetical protein
MAINGKKPESLYNWTMPECNENERVLYDIETGAPYKVSKEYYDKYMDMFTTMIAGALNTPDIGSIFITGTGGSLDNKDDIKDMFYNPEGYITKSWSDLRTDAINNGTYGNRRQSEDS